MKTIDELIDQVLTENNKHWLHKDCIEYNLREGRVPITREDIHDIIKRLPIQIYSNRVYVNVEDTGIVVRDINPNTNQAIYGRPE